MKKKRGFALLSKERQKELAVMGGKAAQKSGKAHRWNSETAKVAKKKSLEKKVTINQEQ